MPFMTPTTTEHLEIILGQNALTWKVMKAVHSLGLPDYAVGAGFVRNQIWDHLHLRKPENNFTDIDVVYFDANDIMKTREEAAEIQLKTQLPEFEWEVRNQARMADKRGDGPYKNTADGISRWVETATAVAIRLGGPLDDKSDSLPWLEFVAPHGIDDLCRGILRPTSPKKCKDMLQRIEQKGWKTRWPHLHVLQK